MTKPVGPEAFIDTAETIINLKGENFYKACGYIVARNRDGSSSCVKRVDHPGTIHEDYDGETIDSAGFQIDFDNLDLDEAVGQAIGAASMCWSDIQDAGVFESDRAVIITKALIRRIRQAAPIYG